MTDFTPEEKLKFDKILFETTTRSGEDIDLLSFEEKAKLKKVFDQKIAFMSAYKQSKAPTDQAAVEEEISHTPNFFGTVCCFLFPESNRDVFDITDEIFLKRFFGVFLFWKKGFINVGGPRSDIYGPVWITALYVILVGLCANLNGYFINILNYKVDEQPYAGCMGLLLIFMGIETFFYPMVVGCLGGFISTNESISLLGYSLVLYYIPTILCIFPSLQWHITMLFAEAILRMIFLFRNYSSKVDANSLLLLIVIGVFELAYFYFAFQTLFRAQSGYSFEDGISQVFNTNSLIIIPTAHASLTRHYTF